MFFCNRATSLRMIFSSFIHLPKNFIDFYSCVVLHCVNVPHFLYPDVEGHLGSFQLLDIINKAAMNTVEHVFLLPVATFSGYMPRRGIAGSSGRTMSSFLMNRQTDFQSGCRSLQSHNNGGVLLFLHIHTSICCHLNFQT